MVKLWFLRPHKFHGFASLESVFTLNHISDVMKKYEFFEHTADVGIKAYGKNPNEMFRNAALAMFDIISDTKSVKNVGEYKIELVADNLEMLLVDFLSELIYIFDTQHILLGKFEVDISKKNDGYSLSVNAFGEEFDSKRHRLGKEIKAVTYHMLEVNEKRGYLKVLFDI